MTDQTIESWFDEAQREGAPSANFSNIGDSVFGEVVDQYTIDYIPFAEKEPARDEKTGEIIKQLVVVLQTDLDNWRGVSRIPTDPDGQGGEVQRHPSKDTGRRAIYLRKFTNIYAAVGKAIKDAGQKGGVRNGAKLGVQFYEEENTGKGNPLKKFRAKYVAPAESNDFFNGGEAQSASLPQGSSFGGGDRAQPQQAPPAQPAPQQAPPQQDPWASQPAQQAPQQAPPAPQATDEPPF